MKTMKYIILSLFLTLGATSLFAGTDGNTVKETTPEINLNMKVLIPQVPLFATFEEDGIENMTILLMDLSRRFAPVIPMEADFEETLPESPDLSPVVPLEAPYSETL